MVLVRSWFDPGSWGKFSDVVGRSVRCDLRSHDARILKGVFFTIEKLPGEQHQDET